MVAPPRGHFEVEICHKGADLHSEFVPRSASKRPSKTLVSLENLFTIICT